MCKKMEGITRNKLGLTLSEIKGKLFELVALGHEITAVKEYYPHTVTDWFTFGITAGKTTYVSYWVGDSMVDDLTSYGSGKCTDSNYGSADKTWTR